MRYVWDEQKNEANLAKHEIDFADAHRIFLTPVLAALDDRMDYGEDRWVGLGLLGGRVVNVVYTEPDEQTRRVISVRKALQHDPCERRCNMNGNSTSDSSRTNWERLDALADDQIDTSDSPPLTDEFFATAQWLLPGESLPRQTVRVELDLDSRTLAWFQSQGDGYERRMLAALRLYAQAHQAVA